MNEHEIEKLIHETKELRDIRDEYQKTQQLLQEQSCHPISASRSSIYR